MSEYSCLAKVKLEARTNPHGAMRHSKQGWQVTKALPQQLCCTHREMWDLLWFKGTVPLQGSVTSYVLGDGVCQAISNLTLQQEHTTLWKRAGPGCSSPALDLSRDQRFGDTDKIHALGWWRLHPVITGILRKGIKVSPLSGGFGFRWIWLETREALKVLKQFSWRQLAAQPPEHSSCHTAGSQD